MSATREKLVIIIVNWNTASITLECLRSLSRAGVLDSHQVSVVDNASTDDSCDLIAAEFGEGLLTRNTLNVGFAAANNQILANRLDDADFFLLLNSDTVVLGDVIDRSLGYMDDHPDVGAMGCRVLNTDRTVQLTCSGFPTVSRAALQLTGLDRLPMFPSLRQYRMEGWDRSDERDVDVISGCYLLVRSSVVRQVGLLDEDFFFFGEETDWCCRMKRAGWKLRFAPIGEIIHHGSVSARKLSYRRDLLLSNAIVRFTLKNYGSAACAAMFTILFMFNVSRCLVHGIAGLFAEGSLKRSKHFLAVSVRFRYAWPSFRSRDLMSL